MFRALRVTRDPAAVELLDLSDEALGDGDVTVDIEYSSLNFKDGLALACSPGVAKIDPLIPGIDLVGTVRTSDDSRWSNGDRVVLNGWGIGETHNGGLAERARVSGDWLVALPESISPKRAAAIGTAGFTAMLAVLALEKNGALAMGGDILVTGAAGGVGSIAIALLSGLGHRVIASTGRLEETDYLTKLGAAEVIDRTPFGEKGKPLQSQRFAGAIDSVGGTTLANVLAQTNYGGTVASCGLAASADLPATVMPFILRAVTLTGINSVFAPSALRTEAWNRLATDLDLTLLDSLTTTIGLTDAAAHATDLLDGKVRGRIVVDVHA